MIGQGTLTKNNKALLVAGDINVDTVVKLRRLGDSLINEISDQNINFDFKDVEQSDSSGLSLMMAWKREAKKANKAIHFVNVPPSLHAIAKLCDVSEILGLE